VEILGSANADPFYFFLRYFSRLSDIYRHGAKMKLTRRQLRKLIFEVYQANSPMSAIDKGINPVHYTKLMDMSQRGEDYHSTARDLESSLGYPEGSVTLSPELKGIGDRYRVTLSDDDYIKFKGEIHEIYKKGLHGYEKNHPELEYLIRQLKRPRAESTNTHNMLISKKVMNNLYGLYLFPFKRKYPSAIISTVGV